MLALAWSGAARALACPLRASQLRFLYGLFGGLAGCRQGFKAYGILLLNYTRQHVGHYYLLHLKNEVLYWGLSSAPCVASATTSSVYMGDRSFLCPTLAAAEAQVAFWEQWSRSVGLCENRFSPTKTVGQTELNIIGKFGSHALSVGGLAVMTPNGTLPVQVIATTSMFPPNEHGAA